jgi:hypothetical protein
MWRILWEMPTWTEMRGGKSSSGLSPIAGFGISSVEQLVYNTIHCVVMSCDGSKASYQERGIQRFLFQIPVSPLLFKVIQWLLGLLPHLLVPLSFYINRNFKFLYRFSNAKVHFQYIISTAMPMLFR